jgi:hypothetical protein
MPNYLVIVSYSPFPELPHLRLYKSFENNVGSVGFDLNWFKLIGFRDEYLTQDKVDTMVYQCGEDDYYLYVNELLDNWEIFTDKNKVSDWSFNVLLPLYTLSEEKKLPDFLTNRMDKLGEVII